MSYICRRHITIDALEKGDDLLMQFCSMFEELYGKDKYTINIHLHGHIKECILDFGPIYSFWLFSFERSYHTNCHDVSLQLMRRYTSGQSVGLHNWPCEYSKEFFPLLGPHSYQEGSLRASSLHEALQHNTSLNIEVLPKVIELAWENSEKELLRFVIKSIVGHDQLTLHNLYQKASAITVGGFLLASSSSRFTTKTHVMATHPDHPEELHLAQIESFCRVTVKDNMDINKP